MIRTRLPRLLPLLACVLLAGACAAATAMRNGRSAEQQQDYDRAVVEYTRALQLNPDDVAARAALERAKVRAAQAHYVRGRRFEALGKLEEAVVEYQLAFELNPLAEEIADGLENARIRLQTEEAAERQRQTELERLLEQARTLAPPGRDLPADVTLPDTLTFREASSRDVFTALGRLADVNIIFDPAFRERPVSIDLRDTAFADALEAVAASTGNFFQVTAPRTITIIPDTAAKRREYEEEVVRTFYLSNVDLKEAIDLLRIVIDARRVAPINATNAIAIKDTPERVEAAARVLSAIDKARAEVVIDVELLEVDRTKLLEYGLQVTSPGADGISGQVDVNREGLTLRDLRQITQSEIFVTNVPGLFYRLLKTDTSTRTLANPHLRTSEGIAAQARFGERVPVPVTTFAPIATGGVAQQPITSFNYENIGVNIDITPRTHHNGDVSLALEVNISNISGTGFGNLPTFGNRTINTTIRLHDGETNMLAGLIRDEERDVLSGVPGLSDVPVIGRLFARTRKESQETDIVLLLTPHIIRVLNLTEADLRPFRVGRDASAPILNLQPVEPAQLELPPAEPAEEPAQPQEPAAPILVPQPLPPPEPGPGDPREPPEFG